MVTQIDLTGLATALGIGMLIGLERERRRAAGGGLSPGGVRTFTVAAVTGAVAALLGGTSLLAVVTLAVGVVVAAAYLRARDQDLGTTTEIALLLTVLLGGLAMRSPALAAGIGVIVAVLLAARSVLHGFARQTLTEAEVHDGLALATAALVIWPLLPDRPIGPFRALNLHSVWTLVVLVMAIGGAGRVAMALLGPRYGLPLVGLASGFVSSSATIGAMGSRAGDAPDQAGPAAAAAALSTVATFVQLAVVLAAIHRPMLAASMAILACGGLAAVTYGIALTVISVRSVAPPTLSQARAFDPRFAILLAVAMAAVLVVTAALNAWLGAAGVMIGAAVAGLADVHTAATSLASLAASGTVKAEDGLLPLLAAITTNTLVKAGMALGSASMAYKLRVLPGLMMTTAAAWLGFWLAQ